MATYFHGSTEMQPEGLQTLYLMNPSYIGYADNPAVSTNMLLLNSTINSQHPPLHHHHQHQYPIQPDSSRSRPITDVSLAVQGLVPRLDYSMWTSQQQQQADGVDVITNQLGLAGREGLSLSLSPNKMVAEAKGGLQSFLLGSNYLKAAQELLDEVVNVGKGVKNKIKISGNKDCQGSVDEDNNGKRIACELTTAEKQELQMKKAKLVNMLDEVEQRYRQYHHQMQIVVSSFEAIAGPGSAKTYTALALQTISKQFRCLRDAITAQIRSTSKSLGEEGTRTVGSRLRFVDHHLRQQRALQQLGIIQHNAWRPQRGLPERSVSILRAWLFEHFLHPYPKDSDKIMLAKQTGLTRSQVSNWFINARVRLWKPMVEEMYLEEVKDQEQNNDDENSNNSEANGSSPVTKSSAEQESSPVTEPPNSYENPKIDQGQASTSLQTSYLTNGHNPSNYFMQPTHKKARSNESTHSISVDLKPEDTTNQELMMKFMEGRHQGYNLISPGAATSHGGNNYGGYTIGYNAEQFTPRYSNNGVSLTLGLQHCENLSLSDAQQSFLSNESLQPLGARIEMSSEGSEFCGLNNNATVAHSTNTYESINMQSRKRFAAQLLPDYVA